MHTCATHAVATVSKHMRVCFDRLHAEQSCTTVRRAFDADELVGWRQLNNDDGRLHTNTHIQPSESTAVQRAQSVKPVSTLNREHAHQDKHGHKLRSETAPIGLTHSR